MSTEFFSYNLVTQDTSTITSSDENTLFPLSWLKHPIATKKTRSTSNTYTIDFDFNTSVEVDSLLFNSLDWEQVTVQGNITSDFTSPIFEQVLAPDSGNFKYNFMYRSIPIQTLRFWRLTFQASVSALYCDVGKIFMGKSVSLVNDGMIFNWTWERKDYSKVSKNEYGQKFIDVIPKTQKKLSGAFKYLNLDNLEIFEDLAEGHSIVNPLWVVLDTTEQAVTNMEKNAMYGYFAKAIQEKNVRPRLYDLSINMEEAL